MMFVATWGWDERTETAIYVQVKQIGLKLLSFSIGKV